MTLTGEIRASYLDIFRLWQQAKISCVRQLPRLPTDAQHWLAEDNLSIAAWQRTLLYYPHDLHVQAAHDLHHICRVLEARLTILNETIVEDI